MTTVATKSALPVKSIGIWVLRILVGGLFLFAATMKLTSQPMMVQEFATIGFGQWFRYLTGVLEAIGAITVLVPAISGLGALLLLCVDVGAFVAQIAFIHDDWIHTIVIGAIVGLLAYLQRAQITRWL